MVRKLKQVCFRTESGEGCQAKGGGQQEHILIQQIFPALLMHLFKFFQMFLNHVKNVLSLPSRAFSTGTQALIAPFFCFIGWCIMYLFILHFISFIQSVKGFL